MYTLIHIDIFLDPKINTYAFQHTNYTNGLFLLFALLLSYRILEHTFNTT